MTNVGSPNAFLILAHDDIPMLERICHRIGRNPIFVHLDKRCPLSQSEKAKFPDWVIFLEQRRICYWADMSIVDATIDLIRAALNQPEIRRISLISGHCYPIKSAKAISEFLATSADTNFIQCVKIEKNSHQYNNISRRWFTRPVVGIANERERPVFSVANSVVNKLSSYVPRDIDSEIRPGSPYFGSQWWSFNRSTAEKMIYSAAAQYVYNAFRSTFAPDEMYFQTIFTNIAHAGATVGSDAYLGVKTIYSAPLHLISQSVDRHFSDNADARFLIQNSDHLFARKLSSSDTDLLDWIDCEVANV